MMTSLTSEVTIVPNAAPMMTPTARSTTLPRMMNVLNSLSMGFSPCPSGSNAWCVLLSGSECAHSTTGAWRRARGRVVTRPAGPVARPEGSVWRRPRGRLDELGVNADALGRAPVHGRGHQRLSPAHRGEPVSDLFGHEPDRKPEHHRVRDQHCD